MFRRTVFVFFVTAFAVLLGTLVYAMLGLSGPETKFDNARDAFADARYSDAIRLLDYAESAVGRQSNPELAANILDLRYRAYLAIGNLPPAIRDLESLRTLRPDDLSLTREQVRATILAGEPEGALRLAESALKTAPSDPELLELAGEACQADYRERITRLVADLRILLDHASAKQAFTALRRWLYGAPGDDSAERAIQTFRDVLKEVSPENWAAGTFEPRLADTRARVQRAQSYFRRALEVDGTPVAAYVGLAYALSEAERNDDRSWLGELYLHRFDHVYGTLAAADLAELHLRAGRPRAALDVLDRFLPPGTWQARLDEGRLDSSIRQLLLPVARALQALGDTRRLLALGEQAEAMEADPRLDLKPEIDWIRAVCARASKRPGDAMRALADYSRALASQPQQSDRVVAERVAVMNERIAIAQALNWTPEFFEFAFRELERLDPNDPMPVVERSRLKIQGNDPEGALIELRYARKIAEHDEQVLKIRALARDASLARSGRGTEQQLKRCLELGFDVPPDAPEELLLPLAERALDKGHLQIALACSRRATEIFGWARWPRSLLVRSAFAADRPDLALQAAEAWVGYHPLDLEGLRAVREARERLGLPIDDLAHDLILAGERDGEIASSLLRRAMARNDLASARHLARSIAENHADDAPALLLVAEVHERIGELDEARQLYEQVAALTLNRDADTFRRAFNHFLLTNAALDADPGYLQLLLERCLDLNRGDTDALVELAERLDALGRPDQAYLVIAPVLTEPMHAAGRTGRHFLLGGRLALRLGDLERAEEDLVAACAFEDGSAAHRTLTLLLLSQDRRDEARNAWWQKGVDDLTSACVAAAFGRRDAALSWARVQHARAAFDTPALALLAILAPDEPGLAPQFVALAKSHSDELLAALTWLSDPDFARIALRQCSELAQDSQGNPLARTLLARAQAASGHPDEALRTLERVIADAPLMLSAYDEAIQMLDDAGIDPLADTPLIGRLTRRDLIEHAVATPEMLALATRQLAARLMVRVGQQPQVVESVAQLWMSQPGHIGVGLDQVDVLASLGRVDLAIELCEVLESHLQPAERQRFVATYFSLVSARLAAGDAGDLETRAVAKARGILDNDVPFGVVVNFLYDRNLARQGRLDPRAQPERADALRTLLNRHLAAVRAGKDGYDLMIAQTLDRLAAVDGRKRALEVCESLLRSDPSMLNLWLLRGRWLARQGNTEEALEGLRWLYHYAPGHPAVIKVVELAALLGETVDEDHAILYSKVDPTLLDTPDGRLTQGLLALRRADYARAASLLADGAPREDGAHLYFLGLARLCSGDADGARTALVALTTDYPDSSFASNAGHFARQLEH
ncbi:MAG: hypothetical protein IPM29_16705 [Planctomycetes bacterium]|nr:hypothetical protein [Planctomycetota bacterium]